MDKNIELIYKGDYNPVYQFLIFMGIHLVAFASIYIFDVVPNNVWVIFQTILFLYAASSIASGLFTNNIAQYYYPAIIVSFIIFFFLGKKLAETASHLKLDEIQYMKNFVFLNILFFFLLMLVSMVFRFVKQKLETM
jgi:hypothetical protein